jgi:hypothetical protein
LKWGRCGARGRGSQPRTREAVGRRPSLLWGTAFDGWTRRGRRRAKARRIGLAESRPGPRPEVTAPGTEIAAWSAERRPHLRKKMRQRKDLVRHPALHPSRVAGTRRRPREGGENYGAPAPLKNRGDFARLGRIPLIPAQAGIQSLQYKALVLGTGPPLSRGRAE